MPVPLGWPSDADGFEWHAVSSEQRDGERGGTPILAPSGCASERRAAALQAAANFFARSARLCKASEAPGGQIVSFISSVELRCGHRSGFF